MLNCKYCDFETSSERGLKVHIRRKHTILTEADYPAECDFCDLQLNSESDMKMHLKESHIQKKKNLSVKIVIYIVKIKFLLKFIMVNVIMKTLNVAYVNTKQERLKI